MGRWLIFVFLLSCLNTHTMRSEQFEECLLPLIPTSFKGRIRPLEASARLWLEENYRHQTIKSKHIDDFHLIGSSPLSLLWKLHFSNYRNWEDSPFFWIQSSELKTLLKLPVQENYFSYKQLYQSIYENKSTNLAIVKELTTYHFLKNYHDSSNRSRSDKIELSQLSPGLWLRWKDNQIVVASSPNIPPWQNLEKNFVISDGPYDVIKQKRSLNEELLNLIHKLNQFSQFKGPFAHGQKEYEAAYQELLNHQLPPSKIADLLEQEFSLHQRLANAGQVFKVLPSKTGDWISINALTLKTYNSNSQTLEPISNFTIYSDDQFIKLQKLYLSLIQDYENLENKTQFATLLIENYKPLMNQPIQKAWGKSLFYPSLAKLNLEYWYYKLPLIEASIVLYGLSIIFLWLGWTQQKRLLSKIGMFFTIVAFSLNTFILATRCFILGRPPVSNMFETVIYVPWIAVLTSFLLTFRIKNTIIPLAASTIALVLLALLKATGLEGSLENVQAVLDSQFWLIIHVLMIVASYGIFALAGILGQIYLFQYMIHDYETFRMQEIGKALLQALYLGVFLLIPGTILGGIWAAQSWGRFWDWDPKESWAFISSCIYLIVIHAYRFKQIRFFGLAIGAVIGLLAISFTWYGVNYILATGLHSYGFGSGGNIYYFLFILAEMLFLSCVFWMYLNGKRTQS